MSGDNFTAAMANRSRRTVETELKFLAELSEITPQQLSSILGLLAGEQSRQLSQPQPPQPAPVPLPVQQTAPPPPPVQQPIVPPPAPYSPPTNQFSNASLNEKAPVQQHPPPPGPPPAYGAPGVLCTATALYAFEVKDHGDLELQPYDKIQVLKYENDQWWYGRNERTNSEGIFPRAWVNVVQEKGAPPPTNYGNMPLEVSQSGSAPPGPEGEGKGNKFEQGGKKFGKKMGNAAIFGAGATMGSNIVNSIF
ncbi:SH3 domain-containing protein [Aspergillus ruber CBS 135680]|uniref:SH3 domain-containing protein n=1 Tax=Aspergillus ruber (strain CBS 135680) TaxID=1388766 RepID=A0A017SRR2_ASPRC|nr:uncharacterized protein EURHEDRAFT_408557 [Aspergillus ruber CBS 135680]EYE99279.1 hypothetical protein EURHEDRAFT_408557 [Aspergillus ruber CBS 135680]